MFFDLYHSFYYSVLIACSVFSLFYIPKVSKPFKWLGLLIIVTLLSELIAKYFAYKFLLSNSAIYHFFTPFEYFIYIQVFSNFHTNKRWKKVLSLSMILIVVAEILNTKYLQPLHHTNTNIMIVESVLLVFISLILFLKIKNSMIYENLASEGIFWFNSAVLMYYSFNILVWGFHSFKVYNFTNPPVIIYSINLIFSGLLYIVYSLSMYLDEKTSRINP
ncbi:MAG: hypothetical protein WAT79_13085 [Saprospiraceae bacterium]